MGRFATDSGGEFRSFPGVTGFRSPIRFLLFNMAFVEDATRVDHDVLDAVHAFYRALGVDWCLVIPPSITGDMETAVRHLQVSARRSVPEMVLTLEPARVWPIPPELRVERVRDLDALREWVQVASTAFEVGDRHLFDALASRAALEGSGMTHYIGLVDGRPVATSSLFVLRGVAGIHAVGTIPEARGRGFGAAMCAAAVQDGSVQGCRTSALQATPSGFPVYFRMGYRRAFDFEEWVVSSGVREIWKA